jgi:LacI family transcriptional regulator
LADVARASGFSPSTASIVLNEVPLSRFVAAKTKRKIQETAKRLGYRPDIFARSLRSQRSHTIGVLVIDIADPFCTLILKGIVCKLMATPYLPIIMDAHNQPHQVVRYAELMLDRRVEGLIAVANWLLFDVSVLKDISEGHLPTVVVGRDFEIHTIKSVCVDNEAGGYAALEHLYQLGHREIAFIRGPRQLADNRPRWKGIRRFANKVKLRLNPNLVQALPDTVDSTASFEESRRLVSNLILSGESFTAILAFDDISAYGAIRALSEHGLQVPADCSVIGFDDIPAAALCTPGLTTIRQPMIDMGEYAAECVLKCLEEDRNEDQTYSASRTLSPELVVRGSTAPKRSHPQKTSDITKPHTSGSEPSPIAFK